MLPKRFFFLFISALLISACVSLAHAGAPPAKPTPNDAFEKHLRSELDALRARALDTADLNELGPAVDRLFDLAIAYCIPASDAALVGDINILRRIVRHVGTLKPDQAARVKALLLKNPELARSVVSAIGPEDNLTNAYAVLALLNERFPDRLEDKPAKPRARPGADQHFADLAAAFCIVYDGAPARSSSDEARQPTLDSDRIAALFDYFTTNASKLQFGAGTSPELLAYIVSTPCSIEELNWALKGYAGNRMVGKLYGTIVYDTGAFKYNRPKKISKEPGGYTLMNIKKVGGVCVEQAHFAANVGRAIGIPTVVVSARGSDVGHAWVGYLKTLGGGGNRSEWDFDEGRYKEYQSIRGNVQDPQSGKTVPDGFVALTAGYMTISTVNREGAVALFDAAERIAAIELAKTLFPPTLSDSAPKPATEPRTLGVATQLWLIEKGLASCHVSRRGWDMVNRLAATDKLNAEQLEKWFNHTIELCGNEYPDFCLSALTPMLRSIKPPETQDKQWEWLHGKFNRRKDLAAAVRFEQGQMWEQAGNNAKAWDMYNDVINRYANDGQIIVEALRYAEKLLDKQNKSDQVLGIYQIAFGRISKPDKMSNEFSAGSTYVAVGNRYAALLDTAGKTSEAKRIREQVAQVIGKEKE